MNIEQFKEAEGYSYSQLSLLDESPSLYKRKYIDGIIDPPSDAMNFGSAVDCLLFEPDKFAEDFHVFTVPKPTGQMGQLADFMVNEFDRKFKLGQEFNKDQTLSEAYTEVGFKRDSLERVKVRYENEAKAYCVDRAKANTKKCLTPEKYDKAKRCVEVLKSHEFTSHLFSPTTVAEYQVPLIASYKGTAIKGIIDMKVTENNEIIVYDLKTTGKPARSFRSSYLQGAIYSLLANAVKVKFIVINEDELRPHIYTMTDRDISIGLNGIQLASGRKIRGVDELITDLEWHKDNGRWEYPRDVYEVRGEIELNMFADEQDKS
jgi:hypothetical protein